MINNTLEATISDMAISSLAQDIRESALMNKADNVDDATKNRITAQILIGSMTNTGNHLERFKKAPFVILPDNVKKNLRDAYKQRKANIRLGLLNSKIDNRLLSKNIIGQRKLHSNVFKANSDLIVMRAMVISRTRESLKEMAEKSSDGGKSIRTLKIPDKLKGKITNLTSAIKDLPASQAVPIGEDVSNFWEKLLDDASGDEKNVLAVKISDLDREIIKKVVGDTKDITAVKLKELTSSANDLRSRDLESSKSDRYTTDLDTNHRADSSVSRGNNQDSSDNSSSLGAP